LCAKYFCLGGSEPNRSEVRHKRGSGSPWDWISVVNFLNWYSKLLKFTVNILLSFFANRCAKGQRARLLLLLLLLLLQCGKS